MSLPSSGQISLDNYRIETGQGSMVSMSFTKWALGYNPRDTAYAANYPNAGNIYSPINVGNGYQKILSFITGSNYQVVYATQNLSMSRWYTYDHSASYPGTSLTSSGWPLLSHVDDDTGGSVVYIYSNSMIIVNVLTFEDQNLTIRVSGSHLSTIGGQITVYHGPPWTIDGYGTGSCKMITQSIRNQDVTFTYNYTTAAANTYGSKLYFVGNGADNI